MQTGVCADQHVENGQREPDTFSDYSIPPGFQ